MPTGRMNTEDVRNLPQVAAVRRQYSGSLQDKGYVPPTVPAQFLNNGRPAVASSTCVSFETDGGLVARYLGLSAED